MPIRRSLVAISLTALVAAAASAQPVPRRAALHYDTTTVQTVSGEVLRVDTPAPGGRGPAGVQALVRAGAESLTVHLGPSWLLQRQNVTLAVGDRIQVTGSRVVIAGKPSLIVAELRKGARSVTFRDRHGVPQWRVRGPGPGPR